MEKHSSEITRRRLMKAAGALAGVAAIGGWAPARAQAGGRVVLGTWGGDYSKLLSKNIDTPLMVPKKYEVVHDIGGDPERRAKMRAEARLPRGTSDLQGLSAAQMYEMNDAGLCLPIDYAKIPNAQYLLPQMRYPYGLGHIYSGKVILYNPKLIATPPTSFADALDSRHGNKLGIIDIQYQYTLVCAALAAGGKVNDIEPGKKLLLECKNAGMRIYPTNEAFAQGLKSEELGIGVMWKARVVQWQNAGISVTSIAPTEGALAYVSGFVIPKNSPNKDGAYAYLDAMLEKSAQEAFAVDMGYNPTVTNAMVAPDLNQRIGFTPDEVKKLVDLDYDYMNKNDVAFKEWWDKVLKS